MGTAVRLMVTVENGRGDGCCVVGLGLRGEVGVGEDGGGGVVGRSMLFGVGLWGGGEGEVGEVVFGVRGMGGVAIGINQ